MAQSSSLKTQQMQVGGMDCTSCKMKIEGSLERLRGVTEASVTVATGQLVVIYDPEQVSKAAIQDRIKSLGYTIREPNSSARNRRLDILTITPQETATKMDIRTTIMRRMMDMIMGTIMALVNLT